METKTRLHPLLTVAAISVMVLSAVGVAALTGVLPHSRSASEPIEHAVTMPAPAAPIVKPKAPKARPVAQAPRTFQAPTPAPLPGVAGVVESVKEIEQKGENPIAGPIIGGIAGAVLGHQVGSGTGRTVATAVGAGAGILGGKVVEEKVRATRHWDVTVRLEDGSTKTISSESEPAWHAGDRVRLLDGQLLKS